MQDPEQDLLRAERLLDRIRNCDVKRQRRVAMALAIVAAIIGIGFTVAGIVLEDFVFLTIGFVEILVAAVVFAGRIQILRIYEEIQEFEQKHEQGLSCRTESDR